jgi:predicted O-methyltransferase YrrM
MNIIKKSHFYSDKIIFEINDSKDNIYKSCLSRLDLFELQSIKPYDRILYLDIDIIIIKDINPVFDIVEKNVLYALEEGSITDEFWGKSLFGDEINNYKNKKAFSSGVLLFNNSPEMSHFFKTVKEDTKTREHWFGDQPYFVYNAFKYNMYDSQKLIPFIGLNDGDPNTDKTISHFCCGPGEYIDKWVRMINCLTDLKNKMTEEIINKCNKYIETYLLPIIKDSGEQLEDNLFTQTNTPDALNKIKNISVLVANKNIKYGMEIGFNTGFSALVMLLSNPNIHISCFDSGEHSYVLPCFKKLQETFGNRITLIHGESRNTLSMVNTVYDFIHIDSSNSSDETIHENIKNALRLSREGTIIIYDIMNNQTTHDIWNKYVSDYGLKSVCTRTYETNKHDIKYM